MTYRGKRDLLHDSVGLWDTISEEDKVHTTKVSTTGVNVYQCSGSSIGGGEREREFSDNGHHLFIEFVPAGAIIDACINPLRTCVCVCV